MARSRFMRLALAIATISRCQSSASASASQDLLSEELRLKIQSTIQEQVNKLISADSGINSKIENLQLQIALPSDIAQAVKSAGSVKFRQTFSREDTGDLITNNLSVLPPEADGSGGESDSATVTVHVQGSEQKAASAATSPKVGQKPCELGWVLRADGAECVMCPEGQTTFKIGENMCRDVTQEDILNTLYSVVHGEETWPEEKKRDWGTKKSACSWAGITCNEQGLITGISFPVVGISNY
mmetsp:Transcript_2068/g.4897  ORF Transcript_2068/g.4897 Transcript_2068/m.4897 type:complete len:242 (-) Transcript_2068:66-791(-)